MQKWQLGSSTTVLPWSGPTVCSYVFQSKSTQKLQTHTKGQFNTIQRQNLQRGIKHKVNTKQISVNRTWGGFVWPSGPWGLQVQIEVFEVSRAVQLDFFCSPCSFQNNKKEKKDLNVTCRCNYRLGGVTKGLYQCSGNTLCATIIAVYIRISPEENSFEQFAIKPGALGYVLFYFI